MQYNIKVCEKIKNEEEMKKLDDRKDFNFSYLCLVNSEKDSFVFG